MFEIVLAGLLMTMLGALGSLCLKMYSNRKQAGPVFTLTNIWFLLGVGLYFLSSFFNIWLLRLLDYSIVLPLTSVTYIWTLLLAFFFLKERIYKSTIIGLFFIIFGTFMLLRGEL